MAIAKQPGLLGSVRGIGPDWRESFREADVEVEVEAKILVCGCRVKRDKQIIISKCAPIMGHLAHQVSHYWRLITEASVKYYQF